MTKTIAAVLTVGLGALLIFLASVALAPAGIEDTTMASEAMAMIVDASSAIYRPSAP